MKRQLSWLVAAIVLLGVWAVVDMKTAGASGYCPDLGQAYKQSRSKRAGASRALWKGFTDWKMCLGDGYIWTSTGNQCTWFSNRREWIEKARGKSLTDEWADSEMSLIGYFQLMLDAIHRESGKTRVTGRALYEHYCDNLELYE